MNNKSLYSDKFIKIALIVFGASFLIGNLVWQSILSQAFDFDVDLSFRWQIFRSELVSFSIVLIAFSIAFALVSSNIQNRVLIPVILGIGAISYEVTVISYWDNNFHAEIRDLPGDLSRTLPIVSNSNWSVSDAFSLYGIRGIITWLAYQALFALIIFIPILSILWFINSDKAITQKSNTYAHQNAQMPQTQINTVPAGWYRDPNGNPCERYWDGQNWTEQTRPIANI